MMTNYTPGPWTVTTFSILPRIVASETYSGFDTGPQVAKGGGVMFKVGDKVKWTSSSSGSSKTKTGEVLVIIPALARPYEVMYRFSPQWQTKYHNISVPGYGILPRNHESYVIAVPAKTSKGKLKLYWPVVSNLEKVNNDTD